MLSNLQKITYHLCSNPLADYFIIFLSNSLLFPRKMLRIQLNYLVLNRKFIFFSLPKYFCWSLILFVLVACGGTATEGTTENPAKVVYTQYCVSCHGMDGKLMSAGSKDLSVSTMTETEVENRIRKGSENKLMMAYETVLNDEQIEALTKYVLTLRK